MEEGWKRVGAAVRAARKRQHLTQQDLADRADISNGAVRAIERGTAYTKVTGALRAVERALGWVEGSIEAIRDGGEPTAQTDLRGGTVVGRPELPDGLPLRVVQAITEGTALETRVVPITPDADMVVLVMGKPAAGAAEIRAALEAWERREGHLDRLGEVADDTSENE